MKKLAIIIALGAVTLLLLASSTFAMKAPYTHGDFGGNSKGCGDCHVTHSAQVAKLLMSTNGSTQTQFCMGCHGRLSPFDVKNGAVLKNSEDQGGAVALADGRFKWLTDGLNSTNSNASLAGGFAMAGNFTVAGAAYTSLLPVTSVHNVRGINVAVGTIGDNVTTYEYVYGNTIPGGSKSLDFECGSCHDPHAGGEYVNNDINKNPRLLKATILGITPARVQMEIDQTTNLPTKYTKGINTWCGTCHDIFDTSGYGATASPATASTTRTGYNLLGGRSRYMHLFGIDVDPTKFAGEDVAGPTPFEIRALALSDNASDVQKQITCLTCHRAHGSSAAATNKWTRYAAYNNYTGSGTNNMGQGSALLRLPNRDVCYYCHGAAKYNHDVTHTP